MRAFFAIVPPKELHPWLKEVVEVLQKSITADSIQWIVLDQIHITLCFLKHIEFDQIKRLTQDVQDRIKHIDPFYLELTHLEGFPFISNPKIISLKPEPEGILKSLSELLNQSAKKIGLEIEERSFRAHMSLARIKAKNPEIPNFLSQIKLPNSKPILIKDFYLLETRPGSERSTYIPLAHFNFGRIPK